MSLSKEDKELITAMVKLGSDIAIMFPLLLQRVGVMDDDEVKVAIQESRMRTKNMLERLG